jgi:nucleoporin NUP42
MVVCKFFQQGNCRYGDRCRNEHPRSDNRFSALDGTADQDRQPQPGGLFGRISGPGQQGRPQFQAQGQFQQRPPQRDRSPFDRTFQGRGQGRGQLYQPPSQRDHSPRNQRDDVDPSRSRHEHYRPQYRLEEEHLIEDLRDARPEWPLSAYSGHQSAPKDLINANLEFSPEEIRVGVYLAQAAGKLEAALQEEVRLATQVNQQVQGILTDRRGAIRYVVNGRNEHPNRWDVINDCNKTGLTPDYLLSNQESKDPFAQQQSTESSSSFDQSNNVVFGQSAVTFGQLAFGQPSQTAFGQPSTSTTSAFAQQQQNQTLPTNQSPFGQPSTFTQNTTPFSQPSFTQPSQSTFGTTGFSQPAQPTFSQPTAAATSTFSQQQQQPLPFGASPFTTQQQQKQQQLIPESTEIPSNSQLLPTTGATTLTASFPDAQPPDSAYGSQTGALQSAFAAAREKGQFPGGVIPEVAPKAEWVALDWRCGT